VELINAHLEDAAATRARLDARGLKASSSHVSLAALRERLGGVADACRTIGFTELFIPSVPKDERDSDSPYWAALGRELAGCAQRLAEQGIALGYHNHHWDVQPKADGRTPLELLFGAPDSPLRWQADVAWLVRGGVDPLAWLQRFAGRVSAAHAKDMAPPGQRLDEDGWTEVGSGTLDWPRLAAACRDAGARWLVAEHDNPADGARFARLSRPYLDGLISSLPAQDQTIAAGRA
jgi:sugar phosphate isomerase/epimerase